MKSSHEAYASIVVENKTPSWNQSSDKNFDPSTDGKKKKEKLAQCLRYQMPIPRQGNLIVMIQVQLFRGMQHAYTTEKKMKNSTENVAASFIT